MSAKGKNGIETLTSAVFDNGRRGGPRRGCDCVQCFGYCAINVEQAARETAPGGIPQPFRDDGSLDLT